MFSRFGFLLIGLFAATSALADPLSQRQAIDFFRDVPSRNLQGLATRSDGRLVAGPVLRELRGTAGADLLWSLVPAGTDRWLVGTGPEGWILELTLDPVAGTYQTNRWAQVDGSQVYALRRLPDGAVLAGSSPRGGLHLLRDGRVVASAALPADSIFDLLVVDDDEVLVGTGNPGRIFRVDLRRFEAGGVQPGTVRDPARLADRGIREFGAIRDRNVRRLARAADGRVLAGSAPEGHLYAFPGDGGAPELLFDNTRAEVTDLHVAPNGDVYAMVVFSGSPGGPLRIARPVAESPEAPGEGAPVPLPAEEEADALPVERFSGRSALVWLPGGSGFPETLASRSNLAVYRLAVRGDLILMPGGDAGEIVGYDRARRRSLTFSGSTSAQLAEILPLGAERFLLMGNNPAGFAVLDFAAPGTRRAETRRLDLRSPAALGALRFNRLRGIEPSALQIELRANRADDEIEGWSPWRRAELAHGGWTAPDLRGRFVQLRLELPADIDPGVELDTAQLFHLPQNRRPTLQAFRILSPNFGLIARRESPTVPLLTLGQVVGASGPGENLRDEAQAALLASQVVPQPGAQLVYWTIDDADGDELAATFSIRRDGSDQWLDLAVDTRDPWVQFDRSHLPDGIYFTRLVVREQAPRAPADRLEVTFEADDLIVDQTPPELLTAAAELRPDRLVVSATGQDARSLLAGIEVNLNNGHAVTVEQPADGILDSVHETFVAEIPLPDTGGATAVEVILHDASGNSTARRLPLGR